MKKESNASLALKAMHRAHRQAIQKAADLDQEIPLWKDGELIYVKAKDQLKKINKISRKSNFP